MYMLVFSVTYLYGRKVLRQSPSDASVLPMTVSFPNITAVGIPLLDAVYGSQTGILIAVSLVIGALTISPVRLAILEEATPSGHARSPFLRWGRAFLRAPKRPVVWAPQQDYSPFSVMLVFPLTFSEALM
jgi:predicted permease